MVFSSRQLQENFGGQEMPLYFVFIDLTKAFDFVSRDDLFKILILLKIGCPPKLLGDYRVFLYRHEGDSAVQRQLLRSLQNLQRREAR